MRHQLYSGFLNRVLLPVCLLFSSSGGAENISPLPEPLTLEAALQHADNAGQYQVMSAQEKLQQAIAEVNQTTAANDITVNLSGRLRKVEVSQYGDENEDNDSKVSLFVRKPLYDFGRTAGKDQYAGINVEIKQLEKAYLVEQREISIVEKYFAVLNADNEFLRHNENLAIGYIRFDKTRENQQLGLASELEVMEAQAAYELIRQNRYNSENLQRYSRLLLAEELGFPQHPPSELSVPELSSKKHISDDVDALVEQALKHSLALKIQHKKLELARKAIDIAGKTVGPTLDAELEVSEYAREGSTRDDMRASLYFDFPLYAGSIETSSIQKANARYRQELAGLQKLRSEMRITVLKLWQDIRQNSLRLDGEMINQEFRDMYLDRSRAEYELEFKTDLGDAMVQFSDSRKNVFQARFALELAWRKLEKLVGSEFLNKMHRSEENNG